MVVAECELNGTMLTVLDLAAVSSLAEFERTLSVAGPWVAGVDFPFGLPETFLSEQGWTTSWADYVRRVEAMSQVAFERLLTEYKAAKPQGRKEPLRETDRQARSQSPLKLFGVPVAKMFYAGAPRLLASGARIVPVHDGDAERVVVEAYPALVSRLIDGRPYKGRRSGEAASIQRSIREEMVAKLQAGIGEPFEFRVSTTPNMASALVADPQGDLIDSVLCAVQAAYAYARRDRDYGIPSRASRREGWIIASGSGEEAPTGKQQVLPDVGLILQALTFAAKKHRDQRRKDAAASPYINHPITLANILWHEGRVMDPAVIAAALLHDTIEDTETTFNELRGEFGEEIADVVVEVTDVKWLDKDLRKRLQVARAARASASAKLVKLADKIANLRDILASPPEDWSLERQQKYFDWAKEVVDKIRGTHEGLERRFDELYRLRPAD